MDPIRPQPIDILPIASYKQEQTTWSLAFEQGRLIQGQIVSISGAIGIVGEVNERNNTWWFYSNDPRFSGSRSPNFDRLRGGWSLSYSIPINGRGDLSEDIYSRGFYLLTKIIHTTLSPHEMKKAFSKEAWVKVIDPTAIFADLYEEKGKDMGADEKLWHKLKVTKDMEGEVIAEKEGFVLVNFDNKNHILFDIGALQLSKKPGDIKVLLRFHKSSTMEEYGDMKSVNERLEELFKTGSIGINDQITIYEVGKKNAVSMKLNVFLA